MRIFNLDELIRSLLVESLARDRMIPNLPDSRKRKVKNRSIRGIVLNENADEQSRFEVFDRINTGSKIANRAEVRRGALIGPFLDLVIELSNDSLFAELAPVTESSVKLQRKRGTVTRFFAYGDGLEGYRDRPSDFLFAYAKRMNGRFDEDPGEIETYRQRFKNVMEFSNRVFPLGFRKTPKATRTPRTRFEALAIGTQLALAARPDLIGEAPDTSEWLASDGS